MVSKIGRSDSFFVFLDWIENKFIPENKKRLKAQRDYVLELLDTLEVPYIKPRAGFFVLTDFSKVS